MIESVSPQNLNDLLPLLRAYLEFYEVEDIDDERNRAFFSQFGEHSDLGCQFLYRDDSGQATGFATVYFSFVTSITAKIAVMNDLFTLPEARGKGIGRQLVKHCRDYARSRGAARLQWLTDPGNTRAQALYDSLTPHRCEWVFYMLD